MKPGYLRRLMTVDDPHSDRASILSELLFLATFLFLGLFLLRLHVLNPAANALNLVFAVLCLALTAGLGLLMLAQFRRLHIAAMSFAARCLIGSI